MPDVIIKNLSEVQQYIKDLPTDSFRVVKKEVARSILDIDRRIKTETTLKSRTGQLLKSIRSDVSGTNLENFKSSIYTDSVYAPIHEHGGVIKAKNAYKGVPGGPYLNIPTKANKTAAGVTRLQAREVFSNGGYVMKFKNGGYGVMMGGQLMFSLHQKVKIPKRLNMAETAEDEIPTLLSRIVAGIGMN